MANFEYSILVTALASEKMTIAQHYRDRTYCENNFDEMKKQMRLGRGCDPQNQVMDYYYRTHDWAHL